MTVDSVIGQKPPALPAFLAVWWRAPGGAGYFGVYVAHRRHHRRSGLPRRRVPLSGKPEQRQGRRNAREDGEGSLYSHIQRLPWKWHAENPTGDIIQRCTSDVERIKSFFQEQFVSVFRVGILILLSVLCMASMNFRLSLVVIVSVPVIVTYSVLFHNRIRDRFTACDENEGILSTIVQEHLTGVRVVRALAGKSSRRTL
jgi:ABC-type multidrug transport system fused ATPase/permease subunit